MTHNRAAKKSCFIPLGVIGKVVWGDKYYRLGRLALSFGTICTVLWDDEGQVINVSLKLIHIAIAILYDDDFNAHVFQCSAVCRTNVAVGDDHIYLVHTRYFGKSTPSELG